MLQRLQVLPSLHRGSSVGLTLLDGFLLGLGPLDLAARGETLVTEHAQLLDLGALATPLTVLEHLDVAGAGHPVFIDSAFLDGLRPPQHQQLADVLDGSCIEFSGQLLVHQLARGAVIVENTHLDETVGVEGGVDFLLDGGGEAIATNQDHGVQVVCSGALFPALGRSQLNLGHPRIMSAARLDVIPAAVRSAGGRSVTAAIVERQYRHMKVKTQSKKVNKAWLNDHVNDTYVKLAQKEGYRARAAYKLKEIDEQLGLIKPGYTVVDLGSTPGAWSQYLRRRLSPSGAAAGQLNGAIIALDILPMEPIEGVIYLNGDFREPEVLERLEQALDGRVVDVVVSDMAPNLSGIESADAARIAHLVELAVDFACNHLKPEGALVVKLFHGSGYSDLVTLFKQTFKVVKPLKPKASRDKSSETFLVGMGLKK